MLLFKKNGFRGLLSRPVLVPAALFLVFFLLCSVDTQAAVRQRDQVASEPVDPLAGKVIVEAGLAMPYGNLGDDFETSRLGLGALPGLELGFRYRFMLSPGFSVSPAFHLVDYRNMEGFNTEAEEFKIEAISMRYSVEMMLMSTGTSSRVPRPFLALGAGLYRNRVKGFINGFEEAHDASISSLGVSLRGGVQVLDFELSLVYNVNRFNTWNFHASDYRERYNWDNLGVRVGWLLPLGSD